MKNNIPMSTVIAAIVALISISITIYTVGASKAQEEMLSAMKRRVDNSELRLSDINRNVLPELRAFDASVAATVKAFESDLHEVKSDVKSILNLLLDKKY